MLGMQPVHALWLNWVTVLRTVSSATSTSDLWVCFEKVLFTSRSWSEHLWAVPPIHSVLQLSHHEGILHTNSPSLSKMPSAEPRATTQVSSLPAVSDVRHKGVGNRPVKGG